MLPAPDEKKFEEMLAGITPEAGLGLDLLLSKAPWTLRAIARRRRFGILAVTVLFVAAFMAVTPQGRALAQEVWEFFTHIQGETQAVPSVAAVVELEEAGDQEQDLLDAAKLPFQDVCGASYSARCSLQQISTMADFPIQTLSEDAGPSFKGATGGPRNVILTYRQVGVNGSILLLEQPEEDAVGQPRPVGASAEIEMVTVNGHDGEYVQGAWYSIGPEDGVSWTSEPFSQTLIWTQDGVQFSLMFRGAKDVGRLLYKANLLKLAEQLTAELPVSEATSPSVDLQALSQQAGFEIVAPAQVPEGYYLLDTSFTPEHGTACLYYAYGEGTTPTMAILERPASLGNIEDTVASGVMDFNGVPVTIAVEAETIPMEVAKGGQATLFSNGVRADAVCPYTDYIANQAFTWQSGDLTYVVFGLTDQYGGGVFLTRVEMQQLAESLMGKPLSQQVDPGRLSSVEAAQALVAFEVKAPSKMVAGLHLDHAAYVNRVYEEAVKLVYVPSGSPTRGGLDYGLFITQAVQPAASLEVVTMGGGFEETSVNGQTGLYRKLCYELPDGTTHCQQELYWVEGEITYSLTFFFPGALEPEQLIEIAESMR